MTSGIDHYLAHLDDVPGALNAQNMRAMQAVSEEQVAAGITGNLLEIGSYLGRSAVALGYLVQEGEEFHVCEPFPEPDGSDPNFLPHTIDWYDTYTQASLEANFRKFHDWLPTIHAVESTEIVGKLDSDSFRFMHLDGGHDRATIDSDYAMALDLAKPGCVLAFSAFRSMHTLEVAAAVWSRVADGLIHPIMTTDTHLIASIRPYSQDQLASLKSRLETFSEIKAIPSRLGDSQIFLIHSPVANGASTLKSFVPPVLYPLARSVRKTLRRR